MTRGLRNNNPGNIRKDGTHWKGEVEPSRDAAFKQFESMAWGYRAMFKCLNTYSRKYGLDTIRKMISRWAPPSEKTRMHISVRYPNCPASRKTDGSRQPTAM